jgi:hypothetical protein
VRYATPDSDVTAKTLPQRWANAERRAFRFVCDGPLSQGKVDEGDDAVLDYVERDAGLSYENGNDEAPDDHNGSR